MSRRAWSRMPWRSLPPQADDRSPGLSENPSTARESRSFPSHSLRFACWSPLLRAGRYARWQVYFAWFPSLCHQDLGPGKPVAQSGTPPAVPSNPNSCREWLMTLHNLRPSLSGLPTLSLLGTLRTIKTAIQVDRRSALAVVTSPGSLIASWPRDKAGQAQALRDRALRGRSTKARGTLVPAHRSTGKQ